MKETVQYIFIYIAFCTLFIVIAFLINRQRLIKKYNLDNGIAPIPKKDDIKEPISIRTYIGASLIIVGTIMIVYYKTLYKEPVYLTINPRELASKAHLPKHRFTTFLFDKGFHKDVTKTTASKHVFEKLSFYKGQDYVENIIYDHKQAGLIFYYWTSNIPYNLFRNYLDTMVSNTILPSEISKYYSNSEGYYIDSCVIRTGRTSNEYRVLIEDYTSTTLRTRKLRNYAKKFGIKTKMKRMSKSYANTPSKDTVGYLDKGVQVLFLERKGINSKVRFTNFYNNPRELWIDASAIEQTPDIRTLYQAKN